jgi:uncharacterized membrane protein YfcA
VTADAGLALGFLLVAALYASVGQAGASGYLGLMALAGLPPEAMKPTALTLNLAVAGILVLIFGRGRVLTWRVFFPFGVLGAPFSFLGGMVHLPGAAYRPVVGALLILSAALMLLPRRAGARPAPEAPPILPALIAGGAVGFVSGMTGTGGGVFLAPLILAMNWVPLRQTVGVTAGFNLLNSAAALAGAAASLDALPPALPLWALAAGVGGVVGGAIGLHHLSETAVRRLLALVLAFAGARLLLG